MVSLFTFIIVGIAYVRAGVVASDTFFTTITKGTEKYVVFQIAYDHQIYVKSYSDKKLLSSKDYQKTDTICEDKRKFSVASTTLQGLKG